MTTTDIRHRAKADYTKLSIGDRLRWLLEVRDIKQTQLAAELGVTQGAISNIVTNASRKPSAPTLIKLAGALNCNPQWILDGEGDPFKWAPVTNEASVELLNLFKSMPDNSKAALLAAARAMAAANVRPQ